MTVTPLPSTVTGDVATGTSDVATVTGDVATGTSDVATVTGDVADATPVTGRDVAPEVRRVAAEHGVTPADLLERLRDVVRANVGDASLCDWCEDPIPDGATSQPKRYCKEECRKEASRYRVKRRRRAAERKELGEQAGSCDVCGAECDVEDALCPRCGDALAERSLTAMAAAQAEIDAQEAPRA